MNGIVPSNIFGGGHAKGILLHGIFEPTAQAKALSKAKHFNEPSTMVTARFSSSTGNPDIPDSDPRSNPRGLAVRFHLAETPRRVHTDIVGKHLCTGRVKVLIGLTMVQLQPTA